MQAMAATLGADVPFFLEGGTVLGLDRGETLYSLVDAPPAWVVLVIPGFGVSTKDAYGWWDERSAPPSRRRRFGAPGHSSPDMPASGGRKALAERSLDTLNDLQPEVVRHHPEIGRLVERLARQGAHQAGMSGSGSAVFGLFPSRTAANRAARALDGRGRRTVVTQTVNRVKYQTLAAS